MLIFFVFCSFPGQGGSRGEGRARSIPHPLTPPLRASARKGLVRPWVIQNKSPHFCAKRLHQQARSTLTPVGINLLGPMQFCWERTKDIVYGNTIALYVMVVCIVASCRRSTRQEHNMAAHEVSLACPVQAAAVWAVLSAPVRSSHDSTRNSAQCSCCCNQCLRMQWSNFRHSTTRSSLRVVCSRD